MEKDEKRDGSVAKSPSPLISVPFVEVRENWNEYQLADGCTLRVKFVVSKIVRVEGVLNSDGSSLYQANGTLIMSTGEG